VCCPGALVLVPCSGWLAPRLKGPAENIFTTPPPCCPSSPASTLPRCSPTTPWGSTVQQAVVEPCCWSANLLFCSLALTAGADALRRPRRCWPWVVADHPDFPSSGDDSLYLLMVQLGLRNTLWALIIPRRHSLRIFLLRQISSAFRWASRAAASMAATPREKWWKRDDPCRPRYLSPCDVVFIGTWSDFLWPLVILDDARFLHLAWACISWARASRSTGDSWPTRRWFDPAGAAACSCCCSHILPSASGDRVKG